MTDEILENYLKHYDDDLGHALYHLHNQWCSLYLTFKQYSNLFAKDRERVDLMNQNCGTFFKNVQDHFFRGIILGICRLTDPLKSMGKKNLTIQMLPKLITDDELAAELRLLVDRAVTLSSFAKERRNKVITHNDLNFHVSNASLIHISSLRKMREAILAIHEPIRQIRLKVEDTDSRPVVIDARAEFSLLTSLYEAKFGREKLKSDAIERVKDRDFTTEVYPKWLHNNDEETNWM